MGPSNPGVRRRRSARARSWPCDELRVRDRRHGAYDARVLLSSLSAVLAPLALADRAGLCIVAPAAWAPALTRFVEARSKERPVTLLALEDVVSKGAGVDPPERIKRALFAEWKAHHTSYALLVGDADVLPVRFMVLDRATKAAFDTAFYPCDLYYADIADAAGAFDAWNASASDFHARYFGEVHGETNKKDPIDFDRVSYVPELGVGRWPVSNVGALNAIVEKTLAWKPSASPRALFAHADGWVDARERVAAAAKGLGAGIELELQLYGAREHVPSPASIIESWERGLDFAFHVGHGSDGAWDQCLGRGELAQLDALRPAILMSIGCSTAHWCVEPPYQSYVDEHGVQHRGTNAGEVFTAPPPPPAWLQPGPCNESGLGEELNRLPHGGAVAYIGCDTGAQPCALSLLEGFTSALAESECVGDAWRRALAHYHAAEHLADLQPTDDWYPPSIFFQGMKFVLFGDPTLALRNDRLGR